MLQDHISSTSNLHELRSQLYDLTYDMKFKRCKSMGQIVKTALEFVRRNYESVNTRKVAEMKEML
jgi:CRISPR/Cas system-associated endonuclease Cas3-HD